jgi:Tfp pilus assembly protein PilF
LLASATVAIRSGQYAQARAYLLQAVKRDPNDVQAWQRLTAVEFALGSAGGAYNAIQRVLALDPKGGEVATLPKQLQLLLTPPAASATRRATGS